MAGQFSVRRRIGGAAALILAVTLAAAGWSGPAAAKGVAATSSTVTVVAHDGKSRMWFNINGSPRAGLVTMRFTNHGRYAHEMALLRLKKGVTLARFKKALQEPDPETAANKLVVDPAGEITGPNTLGPGLTETVYARLKAARYVVICFLPGPDGMPHAMMGMIGAFTVRPAAGKVAAPKVDGTVTLTNHKIILPKGFRHGGTFAVTNTGTRHHDFSIAKLKGSTSLPALFGCVGQAFGTNSMIDTCPGTLAGGVSDLAPGQTAYLRIHFAKGRYGVVSTDGNDFQNGMHGGFTVR